MMNDWVIGISFKIPNSTEQELYVLKHRAEDLTLCTLNVYYLENYKEAKEIEAHTRSRISKFHDKGLCIDEITRLRANLSFNPRSLTRLSDELKDNFELLEPVMLEASHQVSAKVIY